MSVIGTDSDLVKTDKAEAPIGYITDPELEDHVIEDHVEQLKSRFTRRYLFLKKARLREQVNPLA